MRKLSPSANSGFFAAIERFLDTRAGGALLLSALTVSSGPAFGGCAPGSVDLDDEDVDEEEDEVLANGQKDWAQKEGQRNTQMVSYYGESWHHLTDCGSRGGCQGIDLFIKLRVKPVVGANLDDKRVGVVYRAPGEQNPVTVTGTYFTTWGNGDEEWHVKVHLRSSQNIVTLNAWYQDGKGATFFDDNGGELHPITVGGTYGAIQQLWHLTQVTVDDTGVHGKLAVRLADLDFDKDVQVVWTTDGWETSNWSGTGEGENHWRWTQDYGTDYEQWEIDLAIPDTDAQRFEYAIVYRHAPSSDGGKAYEFWDNNFGSNYRFDRVE